MAWLEEAGQIKEIQGKFRGFRVGVHYVNAIFKLCKTDNFEIKKSGFFLIFAQNIDYGYTLKPPH